jgi:agmatinase
MFLNIGSKLILKLKILTIFSRILFIKNKNRESAFNNLFSTYMRLPGYGVHTVHTGKDSANFLHQKYYSFTENLDLKQKIDIHQNLVTSELHGHKPFLLGVPSDNGGGILRGANYGPLFLRLGLLESYINKNLDHHGHFKDLPFIDIGDVPIIPHFLHDKYLNQNIIKKAQKAIYDPKRLKEIPALKKNYHFPVSPLSLTQKIASLVFKNFPQRHLLSLGGDHSVSYPLVKEFLAQKRKEGKKIGILHFDAHTDLSVERLGVDLCFGTWAHAIIKELKASEPFIQVGIRASGKPKAHWESILPVHQFWAHECLELGSSAIIKKIKSIFNKSDVDCLYLSFDIDALDYQYAPSTGTPEFAGLSPDFCSSIIREVHHHYPIESADLVEVAPHLNFSWKDSSLHNPHAHLTTKNSSMVILNTILNLWT